MSDWDHDGDDYWDDEFYFENIEKSSHEDENEDTGSSPYKYKPSRRSGGVPFIVRLLIVAVIASIIGAFNEILGTIVILAWGYIEFFGI